MSVLKKRIVAAAILMMWLAAGYLLADDSSFESGGTRCPPADKWMANSKSNPEPWKEIVPVTAPIQATGTLPTTEQ